jgi:hypothetical protein
MSYSNHVHDSGGRNKSQLETELIPEDNSLDGKVRVPLLLECLAPSIGILRFEDACESRLPNLIIPSLNIHIDGLGFSMTSMSISKLSFLTLFENRSTEPSSSCKIEDISHIVKPLEKNSAFEKRQHSNQQTWT